MSALSPEAEKKELRRTFRRLRKEMPAEEKALSDTAIAETFLNSPFYSRAQTLFVYNSLPQEIDTNRIIHCAWEQGKAVAAPFCDPETHAMRFYRILSADDLRAGAYGILEPDPARCKPVDPDADSLCLVPGFAFDENGFRLGYGGGYYDRFLAVFPGTSVGLCRENGLVPKLPADAFDKNVDAVVLENRILIFGKDTSWKENFENE